MKKRYVISNTPVKFPIQSTVLYAFLLYYFEVSGIFWGVFITIYTLRWLIVIVAKQHEEIIDLNSDNVLESEKSNVSNFHKRLNELKNKHKL